MWPFKHKKAHWEFPCSGPPCPYCGSTNTRLIVYHGTDHPDYLRVWRGQRSLTYRCFDCGLDFYAEEPREGIVEEVIADNQVIDDEEALREAEEEMERQIEEDDDRRFW
jgi:transcription elongation factor Elf1